LALGSEGQGRPVGDPQGVRPEDPVNFFVNACLAQLEGAIVRGRALCGSVVDEQLVVQTERGTQTLSRREIAYIQRITGEDRWKIRLVSGEQLTGSLISRELLFALPTGAQEGLTLPTDQLELLLFRGHLFRLPQEERSSLMDQIGEVFRRIRKTAELIVLDNGSVLTGTLLTRTFQLRVGDEGSIRAFAASQIDRIYKDPEGRITVLLRGRRTTQVQGELLTSALEVRVLDRLTLTLPFAEVDQLVMRNTQIVYGQSAELELTK
jgi:hypothetical protein